MGTKVYNRNNRKAAVCERPDWAKCRDHNPSKGWSVQPPEGWVSLEARVERDFDLISNIAGEPNNDGFTVEDYAAAGEPELMSPEYNERAAAMRAENFRNIREKGLGSNFNVLNPEDSGRKDNIVWVGTCSECGVRVFNRKDKGLWEHEVDVLGGRSITKLECVKAIVQAGDEENNETVADVDKKDGVINIGWAFNIADKIRNTVNVNVSNKTNTNVNGKVNPALLKETDDSLRCKGFTAQGTPCTLGVAPQYSNEYCHQHYRQGFAVD